MAPILRPVAIAVVLVIVTSTSAVADHAPIPVDVQFALFLKIWKLDRNFADHADVTVAILYQERYHASTAARDGVFAWSRRAANGVRFVAVPLDDGRSLDEVLSRVGANVFYVAPMRGVSIPEIARVARSRGVRTITGVPEYVSLGIAVGLGVRNDRPLILVNIAAARAEGSAFQAQLLQLAVLVNK